MTDIMQVLYEYVETERVSSYLSPREYREVSQLTARLSQRLRDLLPEDARDTMTKYEDAAAELLLEKEKISREELEALFDQPETA